MTNEELNMKLYDKLADEQKTFKEWLLTQPPEEILNHAYEFIIREDIVCEMEFHDVSDEQAKALLSSPTPLDEIFREFEKMETDHMNNVRDCIESRADKNIKKFREALRTLPVYPHSAAHAKKNDELDAYRQSHRANVDCRDAIEKSIADHYRDNRLDAACVKEVIDRFGMERTAVVLAATVQSKDWDGRIDTKNKEWAKTVPVPNDRNFYGEKQSREFVCHQAHPGLINIFVSCFRREQERVAEKKPSVLQKLNEAKADLPKKSPTKVKEAEI